MDINDYDIFNKENSKEQIVEILTNVKKTNMGMAFLSAVLTRELQNRLGIDSTSTCGFKFLADKRDKDVFLVFGDANTCNIEQDKVFKVAEEIFNEVKGYGVDFEMTTGWIPKN